MNLPKPVKNWPAKMTQKQFALAGIVVVSLSLVSKWAYTRSHTLFLDDARIASNIISISSKVPGWISEFPIHTGQTVGANILLAHIDSRAAEISLQAYALKIATQKLAIERAEAQRNIIALRSRSQLDAEQAHLNSTSSAADKAQSVLTQAQLTYDRSEAMWAKKLISAQAWDGARLNLAKSTHAFSEAQANLSQQASRHLTAKAALQELDVQEKTLAILRGELKGLQLEYNNLQLNIDDRNIHSPLQSAIIDKTFVHAGEYVMPGMRLMMLHNPNDIWINANVKETDLREIRPNAKAKVTIDAYPDREFTATVERIDHATTSQFALLPNPNPSGNFTKVTQRLTVRLAIQQEENLLKPGMMVEVEIDTRH